VAAIGADEELVLKKLKEIPKQLVELLGDRGRR
jgi:hypothetical protein